jgi:hypothetical protein
LVDVRGAVHSCELRDDSRVGAGWDVRMLVDGEPQLSLRYPDAELARY